jgi:hypothetical protein
MIVIISSLVTTLTFAPEIDNKVIFNIDGIPYCPPRTPADSKFLVEIKKLCHDKLYEAFKTDYSVILINNNPLTLEVLSELQNISVFPFAKDWVIVSFFHKDKELVKNKTKLTEIEYVPSQTILDVKIRDFERVSAYPFIKKVFIPHNYKITMKYLKSL